VPARLRRLGGGPLVGRGSTQSRCSTKSTVAAKGRCWAGRRALPRICAGKNGHGVVV
jgi:hypothetical protein